MTEERFSAQSKCNIYLYLWREATALRLLLNSVYVQRRKTDCLKYVSAPDERIYCFLRWRAEIGSFLVWMSERVIVFILELIAPRQRCCRGYASVGAVWDFRWRKWLKDCWIFVFRHLHGSSSSSSGGVLRLLTPFFQGQTRRWWWGGGGGGRQANGVSACSSVICECVGSVQGEPSAASTGNSSRSILSVVVRWSVMKMEPYLLSPAVWPVSENTAGWCFLISSDSSIRLLDLSIRIHVPLIHLFPLLKPKGSIWRR